MSFTETRYIVYLTLFQINLDSYDKVQLSKRYDYLKDKVRGAGKYQDLLMMGLDNLAVPQDADVE